MGLGYSCTTVKEDLLDVLHDIDCVYNDVRVARTQQIAHGNACIHTIVLVMYDGQVFSYQSAHMKKTNCIKSKVKLLKNAAMSLRQDYMGQIVHPLSEYLNQLL